MTDAANARVVADIKRWLEGGAEPGSQRLIGAGYQASIRLIERPEGPVIVKEARIRGPLAWLRRASLRREYKAYGKLAGLKGIPRCFGILDDRYLILEYVAGPSLREAETELADSAAFFARLLTLIQQMHARGVAHGDLKRKDNILVGPREQPFIVDFGTAHFQRRNPGAIRDWIFGFFRQTDYNAWIKRKYRRDYGQLSAEDKTIYQPLPLEAAVRVIRESWRQVTFRRLRKRLRARRQGH